MGSCNPKPQKPLPPQPSSLQLCCKRLRYHIQIKQNKINHEIINTEPQLVRKINANQSQRNKVSELLIAERVVNGLKYTAVYTLLMEYAGAIGNYASFICENANDQAKLQTFRNKFYSIMYAAEKIPLNTLQEFKKCMVYFEDEILMDQMTDKQIKDYLTPHPTPEEMNMYMIQMAQRNGLTLDKINLAGHNFSQNFKANSWQNDFKAKSNQYRNSLPRDSVGASKPSSNQIGYRKSIVNPFDKKHAVQQKKLNEDDLNEMGENQKTNDEDLSPNITDVMKKIGESKGP